MPSEKDLEEYEKAYLERLKKKSGTKPKPKQTEHFEEEALEPLDYMILGLFRNGITSIQTMFVRLKKVSNFKIEKRINEMKKRGLLEQDEKGEGFLSRKVNPKFNLTNVGKQEIEKKIDEMKGEYDKLVLLFEKKDKKNLREAMDSNRMNFPFMLMMGMTTGMMMGSMLSMNQMNMGDYFADMDYAYDMGYADGSGGAMPADGGDFSDGGGEGGFMDGGMDVGF